MEIQLTLFRPESLEHNFSWYLFDLKLQKDCEFENYLSFKSFVKWQIKWLPFMQLYHNPDSPVYSSCKSVRLKTINPFHLISINLTVKIHLFQCHAPGHTTMSDRQPLIWWKEHPSCYETLLRPQPEPKKEALKSSVMSSGQKQLLERNRHGLLPI